MSIKGVLNVTDVFITGALYWHGREWGPNDPTLQPTPVPSAVPVPLPTQKPSPLPLIADAVTSSMPVSSYDPGPGVSVCNKGCASGYVGPKGSDLAWARAVSGFAMHTGHEGYFPCYVGVDVTSAYLSGLALNQIQWKGERWEILLI